MESMSLTVLAKGNFTACYGQENNTMFCLAIHIITYVFSPWSTVLFEKLTSSQIAKKFSAFYGTVRFSTTITHAPYLSLS